jgi:cyclopropane fatty-acyl-phospholipid synthase-like methyltransferase
VLHDLWHQGLWARLEEALRQGGPLVDRSADPFFSDPEVLSAFFPNLAAAMVETSRGLASRLPEALALRGDERVLDLGGGAANLSVGLARRHPALRLVVLELAPVARLAEAAVREAGLGDRVAVRAGDFRRDPLDPSGRGFDLVLLARVLMGLPDAEARDLLARAAGALAPQGRLAVVEFRREVAPGALLDLDMLLATGGAVRTGAELASLAGDAGLESRARPLGRALLLVEARPR